MSTENSRMCDIVRTAKLCARLIMENGGETSRAEDTVYRICNTFGFDKTDVFAIPTGIFISVSDDGVEVNTSVTRIRKRSVNLSTVEKVNDISRKLAEHAMTAEEAYRRLLILSTPKVEKKLMLIIACGLASGFFALMFNGTIYDFIAATICGLLVQTVAYSIKSVDVYNFAVSIIGGFIIGVFSVLFVELTGKGDFQKIIAGAIMPLLPGVPMVNAIRDTMRGDLLSGVSRAMEALLIAVELAFGVGVVLSIYLHFAF